MGWGVYKQPDGLYAVWSTIVDDFIWYDCSADDIAEVYHEEFGNSSNLTCAQQLAYADGTQPRPRLAHGKAETFATRIDRRDHAHGRHNEDAGIEGQQDVEYLVWLNKMRDLLQRAS